VWDPGIGTTPVVDTCEIPLELIDAEVLQSLLRSSARTVTLGAVGDIVASVPCPATFAVVQSHSVKASIPAHPNCVSLEVLKTLIAVAATLQSNSYNSLDPTGTRLEENKISNSHSKSPPSTLHTVESKSSTSNLHCGRVVDIPSATTAKSFGSNCYRGHSSNSVISTPKTSKSVIVSASPKTISNCCRVVESKYPSNIHSRS